MTPPPPAPPPGGLVARLMTVGITFALVATCALTIALTLYQRFDHDEHQFVVPAILLWQGQIPFWDYLYLHMPAQAFLFAAVLPLHDDPFVASRVLTGLMSAGIVVLVWRYARRELGDGPWAAVAALGLVMLMASAEASVHAMTRTWNHASSVLFSVAAFLLLLRAAERERAWCYLASGAALGLAIGCRLTVLPLLLPFGLGLLFLGAQLTRRRLVTRCLWFGGGLAAGLLPVLVLFAGAPEAFLVGNLEYPRVSTIWHADHEGVWSWSHKAGTFVDQMRRSWKHLALLSLLGVTIAAAAAVALWRGREGWRTPGWALLVLVFVGVGAYMPGRLNLQYNFAPAVFAILALAALAGFLLRHGLPRAVAGAVGLVLLAVVVLNYRTWIDDRQAFVDTSRWGVVRVAATAAEVERQAAGRHVVTLSPLFALMAGCEVDPMFANGPFLHRTAEYIDRDRRFRLGWHDERDFDDLFAERPTEGYLTGLEYRWGDDEPIEARAAAEGFRPHPLPAVDLRMKHEKPQIWVRPGTGPAPAGVPADPSLAR